MAADDALVAVLADKFAEYRPHTDERGWRLYLGVGGAGAGSAAGLRAGRGGGGDREGGRGVAGNGDGGRGRAGRRRGAGAGAVARGGRARGGPEAGQAQPGLREAFLQVVKEGTRGDPMTEITWCSLSLRDITGRLAARGFSCGKDAAARLMRGEELQPAVAGKGAGGQAAPGPGRPVRAHQREDHGILRCRGARDERGHEEEGIHRPVFTGTARRGGRRENR